MTRSQPRPSFLGAVQGEMLKLRHQLSLWLMLAGGILLFGLVFLLESANPFAPVKTSPAQFDWIALSVFSALFNTGSGIILLIVSSRLVAMEYSHGTIRIQLARGVGRLQLLAAKLVALLLLGALVLAGYLLITVPTFYAMVQLAGGSWASVTSVPHLGTDVLVYLLDALISITACVFLGTAAAVVGRSLAFGIAAAMAFFPADNFAILIMMLANRLTHQDFWLQLTGYLLGPNLNRLTQKLVTDHQANAPFNGPLVNVDATHSLVVIGVYLLAFLVISLALTRSRDVLQ